MQRAKPICCTATNLGALSAATNQSRIVPNPNSNSTNTLTQAGRYLIVISAFLGWFFAGMHLGTTSLAMGPAAKDLLRGTGQYEVTGPDRAAAAEQIKQEEGNSEAREKPAAGHRLKTDSSRWFGYYVCALLFGAAAGGLVFGRIGDRFGRVKGMTAAICCYSGMSLVAYFAESPTQLLVIRFILSMGVGGMWPNGVALMSEAWAGVSRPMLAGMIGTAANIGIFVVGLAGRIWKVNEANWENVMLLGSIPIILGILIPYFVPESPRWLSQRSSQDKGNDAGDSQKVSDSKSEIFRPPFLAITVAGILLATVPLFGAWGGANWTIKWADDVGQAMGNDGLKADVIMARSLPGIFGSFLGGWIASFAGRKRSYFLNSLICLVSAQYMFWFTSPEDPAVFLLLTAILGFFSGIFFGWLPLFLPEIFVTRVRSVGAGVCFNFGRILTAVAVLVTAELIVVYNNDFAAFGKVTTLVYLLGAVGILIMPKGVEGKIKD
ncbi:MAG: MFS transporter [Verrucomicrobiota bacterium]|nr:MFS transporter [Verrucomicrobiota bacterium]